MAQLRKTLISLLKLTITVLVVVLLIVKLGWKDIISIVSHANLWWLAGSLLVFFLSIWLGVVQWRVLLKNRGIPLAFGRASRLYFMGMFFNNFVLGGIVGDAVKVASIRTQDGKGLAGLAATFLDRFAGLWAMCGFALIGSVLLLNHGVVMSGKIGTAVLALFVTFILFAGIMIFLVVKPLQNLFFKITDSVPLIKKIPIKEVISEMLIEASDANVLGSVAALSMLIQFLRIGVHAMAAGSLGLLTADNFQYFFIFVPIIAMLMTIPLPFGVREAAGGALFALAGFPTEAAFVMGFLASLIGLAASALGGLFFIVDKSLIPGKKNEKDLYCRPTLQ